MGKFQFYCLAHRSWRRINSNTQKNSAVLEGLRVSGWPDQCPPASQLCLDQPAKENTGPWDAIWKMGNDTHPKGGL